MPDSTLSADAGNREAITPPTLPSCLYCGEHYFPELELDDGYCSADCMFADLE